jgi:Mg/Co/Ni transporter MgtE
VGVLLGAALALGGYARVYLSEGVPIDAAAIALALFFIVNASVLTGATLPFILAWRGVDPAHAGTTVQVLMDVLGVCITCGVCRMLLVAPHAGAAGAAVVASAAAVAGGTL